jgi:hypothetical protein
LPPLSPIRARAADATTTVALMALPRTLLLDGAESRCHNQALDRANLKIVDRTRVRRLS